MPLEIVVAPEADQDIQEAFAWYELQRVGLGQEFLCCVEACVQALHRAPLTHAVVHETYRRALVRRFPYAVFYECDDRTLTIMGVFHGARDPRKWRERLK